MCIISYGVDKYTSTNIHLRLIRVVPLTYGILHYGSCRRYSTPSIEIPLRACTNPVSNVVVIFETVHSELLPAGGCCWMLLRAAVLLRCCCWAAAAAVAVIVSRRAKRSVRGCSSPKSARRMRSTEAGSCFCWEPRWRTRRGARTLAARRRARTLARRPRRAALAARRPTCPIGGSPPRRWRRRISGRRAPWASSSPTTAW